jgi:hypothetical protein
MRDEDDKITMTQEQIEKALDHICTNLYTLKKRGDEWGFARNGYTPQHTYPTVVEAIVAELDGLLAKAKEEKDKAERSLMRAHGDVAAIMLVHPDPA